MRAVGQGYRVCIIQFLKGRKYGEVLAVEKYLPDVTVYQFGRDSFVMRDDIASVDIAIAREGFEKAKEVLDRGEYDMVILDEINVVVDFNLIPEEELLDLVKTKPAELDLILTGRSAPDKLREIADLVSEVIEIKHHYNTGVTERAGIEY